METLETLLADPEQAKRLVEGSHLYGATFADWKAQRQLITRAIHRPGTLLDIGCANGLLLRCLLDWSPHPLEPYGLDPDRALIEQARALLPEFAGNFAVARLDKIGETDLPRQFDLVYWAVWDDLEFDSPHGSTYLERAYTLARDRLILGFYGPSLGVIEAKVEWLELRLGRAVGRAERLEHCVVVAWWDKGEGAVYLGQTLGAGSSEHRAAIHH